MRRLAARAASAAAADAEAVAPRGRARARKWQTVSTAPRERLCRSVPTSLQRLPRDWPVSSASPPRGRTRGRGPSPRPTRASALRERRPAVGAARFAEVFVAKMVLARGAERPAAFVQPLGAATVDRRAGEEALRRGLGRCAGISKIGRVAVIRPGGGAPNAIGHGIVHPRELRGGDWLVVVPGADPGAGRRGSAAA